ncbi:MAG: VCBS repeat-containing protein, partial [Chloroflexi bacterium]|nr:VCBS repeat-containing protein [Chloroflexota bacterium]
EEVAGAWGLDFRHHHGGSGRRYMVETVVGGVVLLDYDGDGDQDVLFVDGGALPGYGGEPPRSRLYRNDAAGRFVEVTEPAGIAVSGYGAGAVAGDVEGDGDLDLYVTAFGPDQLFRNHGDGTFEEATAQAGLGDPLWSAGATFSDLDRDGDLDLYVANYSDYTVEAHRPCVTLGVEVYCHPRAYPGAPDRFYRNRGDGTFEEATAQAGLAEAVPQPGLGVVASDLDDDGWPDLFVANDSTGNYLYRNRGDGSFEERALLAGVAYGDGGRPEACMGVAVGDVDGDQRFDIVTTNFELETNALYRNLGGGLFVDARWAANVAESSLLMLAFGVDLADFDQDGDLDLVVANGHILDNAAELHPSSRYAQPNQLLENHGGRFTERDDSGLDVVRVSRGLATGDLDGAGDPDLAIVNSNDLAEVYR